VNDAQGGADLLHAPLTIEYGFMRTTGPVIGAFLTGLRERRVLAITAADGRVVCPPVEYDPTTGAPLTDMVEVGTELARKNNLANLTYKLGDIESVPLPDKSVDLAILSQALHHANHPQHAVNEACRILKPGGQVLILDLAEHNYEKAHEQFGDLWLGFKESALHGFLKKAGFQKVEVTAVAREEQEPHFETLLASGVKSAKA